MLQANQKFSSILTKIGNGEQLDGMEITLIESRFCTVEEAEASRRVAIPLVRLEEGEDRWKTPDHSFKIGVELNEIVVPHVCCSKLCLTTGIDLVPCRDEFRFALV
ncbi:hypothetical protein TNCV_3467181 [Trichonephila clavipes]|nr:hypothetical protein TNCV_3467181 [Trichonephila clavipes]